MPKRVAITIAGAVSLGSYEAGVMYELLEAIRVHNESAEDEDKIIVDVITGASAGGMTAAMLGVWLTYFGKQMQHPTENPLYMAWVEKISLAGLVRMGHGEKKWSSLLSSALVAKIGTEMLADPMQDGPPVQLHACLEPGAPLRLGLALTNLSGVDYMIAIDGNPDGGFNYTRSTDQRLFTVHPGRPEPLAIVNGDGSEQASTWETLKNAAVACGAFPFAFRACDIERLKEEYISPATPSLPTGKLQEGVTYVENIPPCDFAYTDGGVLQNQPLGIARDLVEAAVDTRIAEADSAGQDERRRAHQDADNRLYAFISPNPVRSTAEKLDAEKLDLWTIGPQVLKTYVRQATFHDWIMAEEVNQSIRLLDERATQLATVIQEGKLGDLDEFTRSAANLNDLLLGEGKQAAVGRLADQYRDLIREKLGGNTRGMDAFLNGVAALEAAAQLSRKEKMHIVAVLADGSKELAGSGISAFAGFFSRRFREHDYMVGRVKAQKYLRRDDVRSILQLNLDAVEKEWARKQALGGVYCVRDPQTIVRLPLSLPQVLAPAAGPLAWMVVLRTWPLLLAGAVFAVARHHRRAG